MGACSTEIPVNGFAYPIVRDEGALPQPPDARLGATRRNAGLDLLRLGAAAIIVFFHAGAPGGELMPAALGVFAAMLGYLAMDGAPRGPFAGIVARRADRLLRPFLLWAALYLGLRLADAAVGGEPVGATVRSWFPPEGTMGPLWFLPFAFVASVAVAAARRAWPALAAPRVALTVATLAAGLWLVLLDAARPAPGIQVFVGYEPALFFGMALAAADGNARWLALTGALAAVFGLALRVAGIGGSDQLALAVPLIAAALLWPLPGGRRTRVAADLSMAVYLLHGVMLAVLLRITSFGLGTPALGLATLVLSAALGLVLLRLPLARRLF